MESRFPDIYETYRICWDFNGPAALESVAQLPSSWQERGPTSRLPICPKSKSMPRRRRKRSRQRSDHVFSFPGICPSAIHVAQRLRNTLRSKPDSTDQPLVDLMSSQSHRYKKLNVLINNASKQYICKDFAEVDLDKVQETFQCNVLQMMAVTKFALPHMSSGDS